MMIVTSPLSAASTSQVIHFSGLVAPAGWGAPFQPPGSPPSPGPGPFPPPPLLVVLFPTDGQVMTGQGSVQHGVFVMLLVLMSDPVTQMPILSFVGNSTTASFQVDPRLTTASLCATVQAIAVVSFSPKTVTITVSWTATDPLTGMLNPIVRTPMNSRVQFNSFSLSPHVSTLTSRPIPASTITYALGAPIPLPPTPPPIPQAA